MKKVLTLLAAVVALGLTGSVSAKTVTVAITKTGFVPADVSIVAGDVVTWENRDNADHQVVSQQAPFASAILKPGQTFSFTFTKTGKFNYEDPLGKKPLRGSVTVAAPPASVTLLSSSTAVAYGASVTLSGVVSSLQAGEQVTILARPCDATAAAKLTTVTSTTGGAWSAAVQLLRNTVYTAQTKAATSANVNVAVKPKLVLRRPAAKRFTLTLTASTSLVGKAVVLQRYSALKKGWVGVRTALLVKGPAVTPPAIAAKATFTIAVKPKNRVRAAITQVQCGTCYRATVSNVIRT